MSVQIQISCHLSHFVYFSRPFQILLGWTEFHNVKSGQIFQTKFYQKMRKSTKFRIINFMKRNYEVSCGACMFKILSTLQSNFHTCEANLTKISQISQSFVFWTIFYLRLPIILHGYIRHIRDFMKLWDLNYLMIDQRPAFKFLKGSVHFSE